MSLKCKPPKREMLAKANMELGKKKKMRDRFFLKNNLLFDISVSSVSSDFVHSLHKIIY